MADPQSSTDLENALWQVLRTGLPVTPANTPAALMALRSVWARAVTNTEAAKADALDRLLRSLLKQMPGGPERARAAGVLFGDGAGGQLLTERRRAAASLLGYNQDHFRKHIVPKMVADLAWLLERDSLQYTPRYRQVPAESSGDSPVITAEDLTPARAEHEILLSRIWSDVYGLRADLIERERWRGVEGEEARFQEAAGGALWYLARLLTNLDRYLDRYGNRILHGEAEFNAEGLIRLAGWTGEVTEAQSRELRYRLRRVGEWQRRDFLSRLVDRL